MPYTKGGWYSQAPAFGWFDKEDKPGSAALGVPDWQQGIALPSRSTLGQWYNVTPPGGGIPYPMQQTDIGPAKWTGRGVDISAAAGHQMGYTPQNFPTDAQWKIEPRDEPRGLGSPAGMPVQAGDLPDNASGETAIASGPPQGRKMPTSLMDMFQPTDPAGEPVDIGKALQSRSNSLIGLGLGLMSPAWAGQSVIGNALQGYQQGAGQDAQQARFAQTMAHQKTQDARQAAMDKFNMGLREREFAQSQLTPYQKMQADLDRAKGTPQEQQVADFYRNQLDTGPPQTREIFDPTLGRNVIQEWDSRTKQYNTASQGRSAAPGTPTAPGPGGAPAPGQQPLMPARKPLTAHEQTAIDDADKAVMANRGVLGTLQDAKRLSKSAFSGLYPLQRAEIGANIPDSPLLPGSNQPAKDTLLLHNAVISQAIDQLKATFGGNPSEGERKILLDMAGSANAPDDVRQEIFKRAEKAAQERLDLNERRAREIRSGTYYNPGGGAAPARPEPTTAGGPAPSADAIKALKANPQFRDQFDAKYGPGAAMRVFRGE